MAKNKQTKAWGSFYCHVEDGEFGAEVKSYNSASRVNELPFSVLLFPARSLKFVERQDTQIDSAKCIFIRVGSTFYVLFTKSFRRIVSSDVQRNIADVVLNRICTA